MDTEPKQIRHLNPWQNANFFSKICFFFVFPIFFLSRRKNFNDLDIYEPMPAFSSKMLGYRLETEWNVEKTKRKPSLFKSLWKIFGLRYTLWASLVITADIVMTILTPYLIGTVVAYSRITSKQDPKGYVVVHLTILVAAICLRAVFEHSCSFVIKQLILKAKIACTTIIYQKTLTLDTLSVAKVIKGQAVTLITKDLALFDIGMTIFHQLFTGFVRIVITTYLVYKQIGVYAFFGVAVLLIFIATQVLLSKKYMSCRLKTAKKTDQRIQLIQEILTSIRMMKLYTWERFFCRSIDTIRRREVKTIQILQLLRSFAKALGMFGIRMSLFTCVAAYSSFGNHINAERAYAIASSLAALGVFVNMYLPWGFITIADAKAMLTRFNKYLLQNDVTTNPHSQHVDEKRIGIEINNVILYHGNKIVLKDINLSIKSGVTIITGDIGSGKTALLKTILEGAAPVGSIKVVGKMSYASQEPWLFPGTIRQNIIFMEAFDKWRYQHVLKLCALVEDIKTFKYGDRTLLSDQGLNLSQGQKLRINLARAVYRSADIYLLDECLASVDVKVGKYIFQNCIKNFLQNKVCVLVSQLHPFLSEVDAVIHLSKGHLQFNKPMPALFSRADTTDDYVNTGATLNDFEPTNKCNSFDDAEESSTLLVGCTTSSQERIFHETGKRGAIKRDVYYRVLLAGGVKMFVGLVIIVLIKQAADVWTNYCVRFWVDSEEKMSEVRTKYNSSSSEYEQVLAHHNNILTQYSLTLTGCVLLIVIKGSLLLIFAYRASMNIHWKLLEKIVNSTMEYFHRTLAGNIVNRFSRDMAIVDELLIVSIVDTFEGLLSVISVLFVVSSVNKWFLIPSTAFGLIACVCIYVYLPSGRNIRRLEGSVRSPVIGMMQSTFDGLTTIRACEAQNGLKQEFYNYFDVYNSVAYMRQAAFQAFRFYLDIFITCYIGAIALALLWIKDSIGVGSVGLAITQSFALTTVLQIFAMQSSELEMQMTSSERLFELTNADSEDKTGESFNNSYSGGKVVYKNVNLRYSRNGSLALKDLNFTIEHGTRVGIVGRTGAGKSSILWALFRLYPFEGVITVNDVDINKLKVDELRAKISIIPQTPTLYSGTVRSNLDPYGVHSDKELWNALGQVEMKDKVDRIDMATSAHSTNFSQGEKQLLCLARALLQNNSIVVFDEAAACVDPHVENVLQGIIRDTLVNCTVITVAHRLHTIMDYDKILVLNFGTIVECGSPNDLLKDKNGIFYSMAKEAKLL